MAPRTFISLPPELQAEVLSYLPPSNLLAFGATSRDHHRLAASNFRTLGLGVFHSRIASLVSYSLEPPEPPPCYSQSPKRQRTAAWPRDAHNDRRIYNPPACSSSILSHRQDIILPKNMTQTRDSVLRAQSSITSTVISRYSASLRTLELYVWELSEPTALAIASCTRLKHLSIKMDHVGTRHRGLASGTWDFAHGSSVWNLLTGALSATSTIGSPEMGIGRPGMNARTKSAPTVPKLRSMNGVSTGLGLTKLESLRLERSGITDFQLQTTLSQNPRLKHLYLRKCTGLTPHIFRWMARNPNFTSHAQTLHFTHHEINHNRQISQALQNTSAQLATLNEEQTTLYSKAMKDVFCPVTVLGPISQLLNLLDVDLSRVNGIDANSIRELGTHMALSACMGGWAGGQTHVGQDQEILLLSTADATAKIEVDVRYQ